MFSPLGIVPKNLRSFAFFVILIEILRRDGNAEKPILFGKGRTKPSPLPGHGGNENMRDSFRAVSQKSSALRLRRKHKMLRRGSFQKEPELLRTAKTMQPGNIPAPQKVENTRSASAESSGMRKNGFRRVDPPKKASLPRKRRKLQRTDTCLRILPGTLGANTERLLLRHFSQTLFPWEFTTPY
jgi:hypothetical protein